MEKNRRIMETQSKVRERKKSPVLLRKILRGTGRAEKGKERKEEIETRQ